MMERLAGWTDDIMMIRKAAANMKALRKEG